MAAPSVFKKKLFKIQALRTDEPQTLEALDALSTFYDVKNCNDLDSRRNLRGILESHVLQSVEDFVREFEPIHERIQFISCSVQKMSDICQIMAEKMRINSRCTVDFSTLINPLLAEQKTDRERLQVMESTFEKIKLSEAQLDALSEGPLDSNNDTTFFSALKKLHSIREIQGTITDQALDAIEISQQEAHERLYMWVQKQCKLMDSPFPSPSKALHEGIYTLIKSSTYESSVRDCFVEARILSLSKRFTEALNSMNGRIQSLDSPVFDGIRYVGDVLKWTYENMSKEKVLVFDLFFPPSELSSFEENIIQAKNKKTILEVFSSITQPLESRVLKILHDSNQLVLQFEFYNVLESYKYKFDALVSGSIDSDKTESISATFQRLYDKALELFLDSIHEQSRKLLASPRGFPRSLSTCSEVSEMVQQLSGILSMHSNMLVDQKNRNGVGIEETGNYEAKISPIINAFIHPMIKICKQSATGLDHSDHAVYMINNMFTIQQSLNGHNFALAWVQHLADDIDSCIYMLAKDQVDKMLWRCGMSERLELTHRSRQGSALSTEPGMDIDSLKQALDSFYKELSLLSVPEYERLTSPGLRASAWGKTCEMVTDIYDAFFMALSSLESSGYSIEQLQKISLRKPADVRKQINTHL